MERTVTLRHLRCFLAVAQSGSFTVASTRLYLTQSALTATIQQFEDAVGLKLFDRTTRRVVMTEAGVRFKPEADRIVKDFDSAVGDLRSLAQARHGHIKIAAIPSVIYQYLSKAMPAFRKEYPEVTISLRDAGALRIEQMVLDGEVDFGITARHKGAPELDYAPLVADRYGVICRPDHPIVQKSRPLKWKDLPSRDYVGFSHDTDVGSFLASHAGETAHLEGEHDEVSGTTALFALLAIGGSYSIVPALATKAGDFPNLVFRPLSAPVLTREIFLVTRRLRTMSPTARHFLDVLLASIHEQPLPEGVTLIRRAKLSRP
jgi:DNA-binding transcriptional LysR family regulator